MLGLGNSTYCIICWKWSWKIMYIVLIAIGRNGSYFLNPYLLQWLRQSSGVFLIIKACFKSSFCADYLELIVVKLDLSFGTYILNHLHVVLHSGCGLLGMICVLTFTDDFPILHTLWYLIHLRYPFYVCLICTFGRLYYVKFTLRHQFFNFAVWEKWLGP